MIDDPLIVLRIFPKVVDSSKSSSELSLCIDHVSFTIVMEFICIIDISDWEVPMWADDAIVHRHSIIINFMSANIVVVNVGSIGFDRYFFHDFHFLFCAVLLTGTSFFFYWFLFFFVICVFYLCVIVFLFNL